MGIIRFVVPQRDRLAAEAMRCIHLAGMEGIPWQSSCRWIEEDRDDQGGTFVVERDVEESGNLFCPWRINGVGEVLLATASLMEREQPYNLPVELARGLINRLRGQASDWQSVGLQLPDDFQETLREATEHFVNAATGGLDPLQASRDAEQAIRVGLRAVDLLLDTYTEQALEVRHQQTPQLPTLLGVRLESEELDTYETDLLRATNAAAVSIAWRELEAVAGRVEWDTLDQQIEWCRNHGLRIVGGPLLEIGAVTIPDWLYLWEDDFQQVQSYLVHYIRSIVQRYQGRVQIWNCASGMNVRGSLALNEEQRLRLVVSAIEEVRREDPQTPLIVTFDQPFAEYLAFDDLDLSPLHFADSLVRADLGVAGIGLVLNVGYWPGGTLPRHRLEISRNLDRWSVLGLPLIVYLSAPSVAGKPHDASELTKAAMPSFLDGPGPEKQGQWIREFLPIFLAKPFVQGVFWNQLSDSASPEFASGGLFDRDAKAKPAVEALAAIKQAHLM